MKIRVINYDTYEKWHEEQMVEGKGKDISDLTDDDFMLLYQRDKAHWSFDSLKEFADEFNSDGPFAPTPEHHVIRFFENEKSI